jgi:mannose-1-phosphate guanylyltransferase
MNVTFPRIAMVLGAGRGVRMRPLSDVMPKPALPLPEGPVVGSAIQLAAASGVRRVVVNTWHLADRMRLVLGEVSLPGIDLRVSPEPELMGTAGGLALARDRGLLDDRGPVLVINGDGIFDAALEPLINQHADGDHLVTLGLLPHPDPSRWSRVFLDEGGLVTSILPPGTPRPGERPFLYPGAMMLSRRSLDAVPVARCEIPDRIWRPALADGRLGGAVITGRWREIGTPEDYLAVVLSLVSARQLIHPTAQVAESAHLGAVFIGRGCRIHESTEVSDSVIAEGAVVRKGARVVRSVLLGPLETAVDETIIDQVRVASLA